MSNAKITPVAYRPSAQDRQALKHLSEVLQIPVSEVLRIAVGNLLVGEAAQRLLTMSVADRLQMQVDNYRAGKRASEGIDLRA